MSLLIWRALSEHHYILALDIYTIQYLLYIGWIYTLYSYHYILAGYYTLYSYHYILVDTYSYTVAFLYIGGYIHYTLPLYIGGYIHYTVPLYIGGYDTLYSIHYISVTWDTYAEPAMHLSPVMSCLTIKQTTALIRAFIVISWMNIISRTKEDKIKLN